MAHPAVSGGLNLTYGASGSYGGFDNFGRVVDQKWVKDSGTDCDRYAYGYDRNSNRLYRKNMLSGTAGTFSELYHANGAAAGSEYDGLDRLKEWHRGVLSPDNGTITNETKYQAYSLDGMGNWLTLNNNGSTQTRTHNAANEITDISGNSPVYDGAGNMTDDGLGITYIYDAWNRLVGGCSAQRIFSYDGLGRQIEVQEYSLPNVLHKYYNLSWQLVEMRRTTGDHSQWTYEQYVWDLRYIDAPVLRWRDETAVGTFETLYYCNDANMNVTALVEPDGGSVVEHYTYTAYGVVSRYTGSWTSRSSSAYKNNILYCGYWCDLANNLYLVRNRVYNPTLGRWMQRDPIGYGDGMSLYEYCGSLPPSTTDPMGLGIERQEPVIVIIDGQKYKAVHKYRTVYLLWWQTGQEYIGTDYYHLEDAGTPGAEAMNLASSTAIEKEARVSQIGTAAGQTLRTTELVVAVAGLCIPGPDDAIIAAIGAKIIARLADKGIVMAAKGCKWALSKGGKELTGAELKEAEKLAKEAFEAEKAAQGVVKPTVADPKLNNIVEDLYKGTKSPNQICTGSTADAIRNELKTGQPTNGKFHSQKGQEYVNAIQNWLKANPNASAGDRASAQQMLDDLKSALGGK